LDSFSYSGLQKNLIPGCRKAPAKPIYRVVTNEYLLYPVGPNRPLRIEHKNGAAFKDIHLDALTSIAPRQAAQPKE
jgi:hypothetical protein